MKQSAASLAYFDRIAATKAYAKPAAPVRTPARRSYAKARKGCTTGGNCSSFGSGRSCGGHDCDGM